MLRLGAMVGLDDFFRMRVPDADFSELLLFNGDLHIIDGQVADMCSATPRIELVHVQEFMEFEGSEVMVDLSSESEAVRASSVDIVCRTRDVADSLGCRMVVIHPGGIHSSRVDRSILLENLKRSLADLGPENLLLENMPWYYWYRKEEQMVSNICVSIEDMKLVQDLVDGFTLDMCHGYLSRPEGDEGYNRRFIETFGQDVLHIHASDAKAPDREGLQIGEGEVDFSILGGSGVPVLVEIWNGHVNDGEGFRIGIERLREMFR
ncbi:MAG: sugar phosphate isomerase/epimerase [Candidatus Thermoplasmatota archaeon]|nr:sugar phosphate isomerase/epimerase [Candidatus Thermoplasmatota archaeon]